MWFIPAFITVIAWGTADLFYKKGNQVEDRYSALKTTIMVGLVMGLHVLFYYVLYQGISYDAINLIKYLPVSFMYIFSMYLGYVGNRYIELSIASPIGNSSGAVSALLTFIFLGGRMEAIQFVAIAVITVGIFLLSVFEKKQDEQELLEAGEKIAAKYRISAIAIIFPILYCVIDGIGTFLDGYYLEFRQVMPEAQANMSYELTFFIVALILWFYVEVIKKDPLIVFHERDKGLAALFETGGQFFYISAMATNSIVAAPMIGAYSIVSIILSRIFLKEKLTLAQYLVVAAIMAGIAILGFYDG